MGGLLVADSVTRLQTFKRTPDEPLWPKVVGVLAFDTPVSTKLAPKVVYYY